ncbi:MAG: Na/Pi cotransporter family protein [Firmicutes bacterium]|nr:Na/Pi cotransporter family protein [Bacillota bacterium]
MNTENILTLLGGVAMFLFGMSVMGDSLKKVAGSRMEMILYKLSGNTLKGVLLGTVVTAVIQSSSATSVMVVGFVNSGMMKVRQAIGIILGAILGTSVTGWVLCLNSLSGSGSKVASVLNTAVLTGIMALAGIIMWMFVKNRTYKNLGGILLGFSVLMYGMSMMSGAISPLRTNETFIKFLTSFSNPVVGILAGIVVTAVIQSASAAVGILQALAVTGAITFDIAFPMLMGIGIGASLPVILSAIGADANGKRTAFTYLFIDVIGAVLCGIIFYGLNYVFSFEIMGNTMTMVLIALVNSLYRIAVVILLAPFTGLMEKLVCRIFPESKDAAAERADMDRLETRFLDHPALSIEQSRMVIDSMAEKALESVKSAVNARQTGDKTQLKRVMDLEAVLDRYEDKLGAYLSKVTSHNLTDAQSLEVSKYLRALSDFERMSDHARNVGEAIQEIEEKKIEFSGDAKKELLVLEAAITEITGLAINAFISGDTSAALKVDPLEEVVDFLCDELKKHHIDRVSRQECTLENGFVFNDLLTDYERIADHCDNIAMDVIESGSSEISAHEYHKRVEYRKDDAFRTSFREYQKKYSV